LMKSTALKFWCSNASVDDIDGARACRDVEGVVMFARIHAIDATRRETRVVVWRRGASAAPGESFLR